MNPVTLTLMSINGPDRGHWRCYQSIQCSICAQTSCSLAATTAVVMLPALHGQWRTVWALMPYYKVGANPPDHNLHRICLVGLEADEAYQRFRWLSGIPSRPCPAPPSNVRASKVRFQVADANGGGLRFFWGCPTRVPASRPSPQEHACKKISSD